MNNYVFALFTCFSAIYGLGAMRAEAQKVDLQVGDSAPDFSGTADDGAEFVSTDVAGKKILVVYFYPADMTGGCTKQACSYRDAMQEFSERNVQVIGISGDSAENHQKFKEAHDLNFTLLADPKGEIAKAFGVKTGGGGSITTTIGDKEFTLDRGVTASRWTFVIDKGGTIAYKNTSVNPSADRDEVMTVVEKLEK